MKLPNIMLSSLLGIGSCISACWGQCPYPDDANSAALIAYIQKHQAIEQDPCIDKSFKKLNKVLPTSDLTDEQILVLIRFLDHRRLPSAAEQQGFQVHFSPPADQYPAIGSIFLIGSRAGSLLLSALSGSGTPRFRENAALAWSLIHRDDPSDGVRALVQAASAQSDPEQANNLRDAAISVAHNCPASAKEKCDSELPH